MVVRAVVFDIGGVLEITPDLGTDALWCKRSGLTDEEYRERSRPIWRGGSIGTLSLDEVHAQLGEALGLDAGTVTELMDEVWREYLGTGNTELIEFARSLRPRLRTGILSNSFVGAREREQAAYGFEDLVDEIIYTHEVGFRKPEPQVYELTCARIGVAPDEMVFLDDVPVCVEAAQAYGIHAILFQDNAQAIAAITELLDRP